MTTYSNSKINTYLQCPQKYKFQYIDKIQTEIENTIEAFMGDLVHRTLEKLYKDLQYTKTNTLNDLINYYEEIWKNEYSDKILIVKKEYTQENYKEKGKKMIQDYYESYHPFNQDQTIGLETQDFYDLNENYKIHVRIDRLAYKKNGIYEIHDYKTNNQLKTQPEADEDRQLAIYCMGIKEKYPDAKKIILVWHFLAFNKEIRSERTNQELEELKKEILQDIKNIETAKEFQPQKSPLCDYCPYQQICPAFKHLYETQNITEEQGKKLVNIYALLKEKEEIIQTKIHQVSEKIKIYAQQKNITHVYGDHHVITIWKKNTNKLPNKNDPQRPELIKAIKALNLYEIYSDLDTWALEKDYDKLTEIEKQVLNHFTLQTTIQRLYLKKK